MDQTTRGLAKTRTGRHHMDGLAPVSMDVHQLQNRCAGESLQAGSIPVRLRQIHTPVIH